MPWSIDELAAADSALSPPVADEYEAAIVLNAQTVDPAAGTVVDVLTLDVKKLLMRRLEYGAIKDASRNHGSAAIRAASLTLMAACEDSEIHTIGMSDPGLMAKVTAMLAAFVGAALIAQETMDDLLAMTKPKPSLRWEPLVTARDVWIARGQPGLGGEA